MVAHGIWAQIWDGHVQNIIVADDYMTASLITKQAYGSTGLAVDVERYPCHIGDIYRDGYFIHVDEEGNEVVIEALPTDREEIDTANLEVTNLQLALVDQYEQNEALQSELTDTQMALVEMYEGMEAMMNG